MDFASSAISNMRKESIACNVNLNLIHFNIFDLNNIFQSKFDIVLEYTCYCAIDTFQRKKYRDLIHQILLNGGKFISLFFPILKPETDDGPPFGVNLKNTIKLFEKKFEIIQLNKSVNSHPKRKGNEVLVIMRKNG